MSVAAIALVAVAFSAVISTASGNSIITSPAVTNWGTWADFERCPDGKLARIVQLKTHANGGLLVDNTSLNGLRFYCSDNRWDPDNVAITSAVGTKGNWGNQFACGEDGYITGFQLRVDQKGALKDNTATNNARIFCSNHNNGNYIVGDGERYGDWGDIVSCPAGEGVCGIRTQVQAFSALLDSTGLNNISLECCVPDSVNKYGNNKRKRFVSV